MKLDSQTLWTSSAEKTRRANITRFRTYVEHKFEIELGPSYASLHAWSVEHSPEFWRSVWDFCNVIGEPGDLNAIPHADIRMWKWFPQASLNFAEALLRPNALVGNQPGSESPCLIAFNESGVAMKMTRRDLTNQVIAFANCLTTRGVKAGDRVAAVIPNGVEAIVAMLGTTAIGAIWSSCSPEFGEDAICDRFIQIEPCVIVTTHKTTYAGKTVSPVQKVLATLARLPSVKTVICDQCEAATFTSSLDKTIECINFPKCELDESLIWQFPRLPFDHPVCIVFSSGTTGIPKCIVHRAGGVVLQHVKEHQLHCDLKGGDVLFYYTTTGWMMWNWLVSGLASNATIVTFDGSPVHPDYASLWNQLDQTGVTHFGASPRYFRTLEQAEFKPGQLVQLENLRCVLSTGSPLLPETFQWCYEAIKSDMVLSSISGGTDILSCFVGGNPTMPVRAGEIQCKGLGMDVEVIDEHGKSVIDVPGELACANAFPSMPIGFWNDPNDAKYEAAYFARCDNKWVHGDWAKETSSGSFWIYGRSDATLNPSGVRIGTAEIYQQVESFPEIAESLATVLKEDGDEHIILFVKMVPGCSFNTTLADAIRTRLRQRCSPRHAPKFVADAPDLPRTMSNKLSEIAVRNAICGQDLGNAGALSNPESLDYFRKWKTSHATQ